MVSINRNFSKERRVEAESKMEVTSRRTCNGFQDLVHSVEVATETGVVIFKTLAKYDGADVVGHGDLGQFGQVSWSPLQVLNSLYVVSDLLLDLVGQKVLAHAELA